MKYLVIVCVFLTNISMSFAQKTSSDIRMSITNHMNAMETKEYETALDHYYTKYFQIVPRSELLKDLKKLDTNDMMTGSNKLSKIISVSEVVMIDKVQYAFATYESKVVIQYKDNVEEEIILYVKQRIEATENKVSYAKEKKEITYFRNSDCIVIQDNGWKMIPYSKKLAPFIKTMIPKSVFEKLEISKLK